MSQSGPTAPHKPKGKSGQRRSGAKDAKGTFGPARSGRVPRHRRHKAQNPDDRILLYGLHAVEAALRNPARPVFGVHATANAAQRLEAAIAERAIPCEIVRPTALDRLLPADAVHQGIVLEAGPLPALGLEDLPQAPRPDSVIVVLDQVTDPHNVGAVLRSAAAFGADAMIMQQRHSPPLSAVLAKSASGALDMVPVVQVRNLAEALEELKLRGFWLVGFAEQASEPLEAVTPKRPLAVVLGAEGRGLRQLTRTTCNQLCRISTKEALASLNVSNAAAIALHWASTAGCSSQSG